MKNCFSAQITKITVNARTEKRMDICYIKFIHQLRIQELKMEKYTTMDTANLTTRTEKEKM
jgi:hypothetical protein